MNFRKMAEITLVRNALLPVEPDRMKGNACFYLSADIEISGGRIARIVRGKCLRNFRYSTGVSLKKTAGRDGMKLEAGGAIVLPGFIDIHLHGGGGEPEGTGPLEEAQLEKIIEAHLAGGTTSMLISIMTDDISCMRQSLRTVAGFLSRAKLENFPVPVLGAHLEGPFISPEKAGVHPPGKVLKPALTDYRNITGEFERIVKMVTIAPELEGALTLIKRLAGNGVVVSLGHSNATYEEGVRAIKNGALGGTHLMNAMTPVHHREPGLAVALLESEKTYVELIVDGKHIHPAILEMIRQLKKNIVLVTDAMPLAGTRRRSMDYGGEKILKKGDSCIRERDGKLFGSALRMVDAFRNYILFTGASLLEASRAASENPARLLGVYNAQARRKGKLRAGYDADLVLLDHEFKPVATILAGRLAYSR